MEPPRNDLLLLAGKTLTLLVQIVMGIAIVGVIGAAAGVLFAHEIINAELRAEYGAGITALPVPEVLGLLALAVGVCALVFLFFGRLRDIIGTVGEGDPFVPQNADRLNAMAWMQIVIYVLVAIMAGLASLVTAWAGQFSDVEVTTSASVDFSSVLLILILFILARVFRHGAAMRADLEGTV